MRGRLLSSRRFAPSRSSAARRLVADGPGRAALGARRPRAGRARRQRATRRRRAGGSRSGGQRARHRADHAVVGDLPSSSSATSRSAPSCFRMEVENDALRTPRCASRRRPRAVPASPPRAPRPPPPAPAPSARPRPPRAGRAPPAPPPRASARRRRRHPAHPPRPARRRQRRTASWWIAQSCGRLIYIAAAPFALSVRTAAPAPARGPRSARDLRGRAAESPRSARRRRKPRALACALAVRHGSALGRSVGAAQVPRSSVGARGEPRRRRRRRRRLRR